MFESEFEYILIENKFFNIYLLKHNKINHTRYYDRISNIIINLC